MLQTHSDLPTSYQYGAPLSNLIAEVVRASQWLAPRHQLADDDVTLRWVGRFISVVICATGSSALYWAGRTAPRTSGNSHRIGVYAALTYAFAYELVTQARYTVTDASVVALCAWTLAAAGMYVRTRRIVWAVTSIVAAGVTFSFKFPAVVVVMVPMACIAAVAPGTNRRGRAAQLYLLLGAGPIALGCFVILNPHFVDHWPQASHDLAQRIAQTRNGGFSYCYRRQPGLNHLESALTALFAHTFSRSVAISSIFGTSALTGIIISVCQRFTLLSVAAAHALAVICGFTLTTSAFLLRNYLIAVPAMCLGVGVALESISKGLDRPITSASWATRCKRTLPIFLLVPLGIFTLHDSIMNHRLSRDTRMLALDWIHDHSSKPTSVVSLTPSVVGPPEHVGPNIDQYLDRGPSIQFKGHPTNCGALERLLPDFVVSASFRGRDAPTTPYIERWYITECAGYEKVASFDANPYEATFLLYPTWAGRISTIVLARRQ